MKKNNPYEFLSSQCEGDEIKRATVAVDVKLAELKKEYESIRSKRGVCQSRYDIYNKACAFLETLDSDLGASDSEPRRNVYEKIVEWDAIDVRMVDGYGKPVRNFQFEICRALMPSGSISICDNTGVKLESEHRVTTLYVKGKVIAKFSSEDFFRAIEEFLGAHVDVVKGYANEK